MLGLDLRRGALDAERAVDRTADQLHAVRQAHGELDRDLVAAIPPVVAARAIAVFVAGGVLVPDGADDDVVVGELLDLDAHGVAAATTHTLLADHLGLVSRGAVDADGAVEVADVEPASARDAPFPGEVGGPLRVQRRGGEGEGGGGEQGAKQGVLQDGLQDVRHGNSPVPNAYGFRGRR